jgi:undecaprenyl-diphosphatase
VIVKYFYNLNLDNISISIENLLVGLIVSFITGLLTLKWLISLLNKGKLWYFGIYCIGIGTFSFLFF